MLANDYVESVSRPAQWTLLSRGRVFATKEILVALTRDPDPDLSRAALIARIVRF